MSKKQSNTRRAVMDALLKLASNDPAISVVCADSLKSMRAGEFAEKYPDRLFDVGICEQNAVDFGAGLAASGLKPYVATYAGFLTMRACEQMRTFVAYPKLNVKFIGANGGIYGGEREGVTHQFFEDLGIVRSIPGITVVVPADGREVYQATKALAQIDGPAYLRVGSDREPFIFEDEIDFELGKIRVMRDYGDDVVVFATGSILYRALKAVDMLYEEEGIKAKVVEVHTLKPLDEKNITSILRKTGAAVTVEDHNIIGGLGSAISETSTSNYPVPIVRIGLQDIFPESGEAEQLLDKYNMAITDIKDGVKKAIALK
ncbi:transketolase [Iocasia frigidifontis]|uniref:Transketolase n=1 Tax=Iocasia fonsfrigidae TaxID=2682810 RepID=A0A8A7KBW4_9FIRM|nr:transketolase C-terminal domain-containing protein [Iocasia fonsfrigidae]QTL99343.1 transketolase [Iocasia fonsfrigidae]